MGKGVLPCAIPLPLKLDSALQVCFLSRVGLTFDLSVLDGVFVDVTGNLYIADTANNRILQYGTVPTPLYVSSSSTLSISTVGSAVINQGATLTVASTVSVLGNLDVLFGSALIASTGALFVNQSMFISSTGALRVSLSSIVNVSGVFSMAKGSSFTLALEAPPPMGMTSLTFQVARFGVLGDSIVTATPVQATFANASCYAFSIPVPTLTSNELHATVMILSATCGLSTGVIIGIVVGILGGIMVALAIVLIIRFQRQKSTGQMQKELRAREMGEVRTQYKLL